MTTHMLYLELVKLGSQINIFLSTMIIISLFTLGSIYSTYASGAEQMSEINNSNKHNRVKNPN